MLFADADEARLMVRVNKRYYRGLTLHSKLKRGTVLYSPTLHERSHGVASADENEPSALKERYLALDNETPLTIAKKLGVDVHRLCELNVALHPGFKRSARLKENTAVRVPYSVTPTTLHRAMEASQAPPSTAGCSAAGRGRRPKRRNPRYESDNDDENHPPADTAPARSSKRGRHMHHRSRISDVAVDSGPSAAASNTLPDPKPTPSIRFRSGIPLVLRGSSESAAHGASKDGGAIAGDDYTWQQAAAVLHCSVMGAAAATHFLRPVDTRDFPDYLEVIENPMDFGTIRAKLAVRSYTDLQHYADDMQLVVNNAKAYNEDNESFMKTVHQLADTVENVLQRLKHGPHEIFPHYNDPTMENPKTRKAVLRRHELMMKTSDAAAFNFPVDPEADGVPDYFHVISHPMDFTTVVQHLRSRARCYRTAQDYVDAVELVFTNACMYNESGSDYWLTAHMLHARFKAEMHTLFGHAVRCADVLGKVVAARVIQPRITQTACWMSYLRLLLPCPYNSQGITATSSEQLVSCCVLHERRCQVCGRHQLFVDNYWVTHV
eukprot:m.1437906 g.1437906  ORF g.1437906 m.1437906 type:complete len:551 (+) comp25088_c0_seq43:493-2145(+)